MPDENGAAPSSSALPDLVPLNRATRVPPSNLEAEVAVLGGILLDNKALRVALKILQPDHFCKDAHRQIFDCLNELVEKGEVADLLTMTDRLRQKGQLEAIGGPAALSRILDAVATAAHVEQHARLVRAAALRRRAANLAADLDNVLRGEVADPDRRIREAAEKLGEIACSLAPRDWPEPIPFGAFEPAPFPTWIFPPWVRSYVEALSESTQAPIEIAAAAVLGAASAAIARRVRVRMQPDHTEPVNLYVLVSAESGDRKSTVLNSALAPLRAFESAEADRMRPIIREAQLAREMRERALESIKANYGKAKQEDRGEIERQAKALAAELDTLTLPSRPRLIADDATVEALGSLLVGNGGRMLVAATEGAEVLAIAAGRYARDGAPNLGLLLKAYTGDDITVDRKGRPPEFVSRPALTVLLAVQPSVVQGLTQEKAFRGRGLLARFLYLMPLSRMGSRNTDPAPMSGAVQGPFERGMADLLHVKPATDADGNEVEHVLAFSADGRAALIAFATEKERDLSTFGTLEPIRDWGARLHATVARVAGILHALEDPGGGFIGRPISLATVERAIEFTRYSVDHAKIAFEAMGADPKTEAARYLLEWLRRTERARFTIREVQHSLGGERFRKEANDVRAAAAVLVERGWVREDVPRRTGGPGRNSEGYDVNPCLFGGHSVDSVDGFLTEARPGETSTRGDSSGEARQNRQNPAWVEV